MREQDVRPTLLDLPDLAEAWGTEDFDRDFLDAMREHESALPLMNVCPTGSPSMEDNAEFYDLQFEADGVATITGSFGYSFVEETGMGCRDRPFSDRLRGRFDFTFNHQTGELRVEAPRMWAEYDPEEF